MWIKICGITRIEDAHAVADAKASAIGLNFFPGSKRYVSTKQATEILSSLRQHEGDGRPLDVVGVFVNSNVDEVVAIASQLALTAVQFHGDETISSIASFHQLMPQTRIIRAVRVSMDRINDCLTELDLLQREVPLSACLLDAFVANEFGGTGARIDLRVAERYLSEVRPPLIIAGGLTPLNVADVVLTGRPWGVDTASGVESSPGIKEQDIIVTFVDQACLSKSDSPSRL